MATDLRKDLRYTQGETVWGLRKHSSHSTEMDDRKEVFKVEVEHQAFFRVQPSVGDDTAVSGESVDGGSGDVDGL